MEVVINWAPALVVVVLFIALVGYLIALVLAAFGSDTAIGKPVRAWFDSSPACNLGIPCSGLAAFAIVSCLLRVFPPQKENGELLIQAFSLKFSGPSGPVTLWVICFLAFVFSMKLLGK